MSAELIPLKKAGDTITLAIVKCSKVPVGKFPEYEFVGTAADKRLFAVVVPQTAVSRQLARMEQTVESVVGLTLTFSRDPNPADAAKPYWGITLASGATPSPAPVPAQAAVANAAPAKPQENGAALYSKITDHVLTKVIPKYAAVGIEVTMEGTAAIVATLYINACKHH